MLLQCHVRLDLIVPVYSVHAKTARQDSTPRRPKESEGEDPGRRDAMTSSQFHTIDACCHATLATAPPVSVVSSENCEVQVLLLGMCICRYRMPLLVISVSEYPALF